MRRNEMRTGVLCICAAFLFAAGAARAQQPDQDPIGQSFFAPELVIQHQEAIGLSAEQKDYFKTEIRQAQLKFTELQWKLQDELEKLLAAEREVKRGQVTLLVRIKNKLTPEQQGKLAELRKPANK